MRKPRYFSSNNHSKRSDSSTLVTNSLNLGTSFLTQNTNVLQNGMVIEVKKINHATTIQTDHLKTIYCVVELFLNYVVTGSDDSLIKIWDVKELIHCKTLSGHKAGVKALLTLANGNIVSASWDKTIKIWNTSNIKKQLERGLAVRDIDKVIIDILFDI